MGDTKVTEQKQKSVTPIASKRKSKGVEARYVDYFEFFKEHLGDIKRDIFSGDIMYKHPIHKRYFPVMTSETMGMLRSRALDSYGRFKPQNIESHLFQLQSELQPKLLVDIPEWDGLDRLEQIVSALTLKNCTHIEAYELLKDWGAALFRRLDNPTANNRILILVGKQGIGKDSLIRATVGGLGDYLIPLTITAQERDTFQQVCSGLVMHISEFDRTNKAEVATLKHLITADRLNFRGAYERKALDYKVRASFIASCNVENILRDETGNRRYIIFDIESIKWDYPTDQSLQVLAQWRRLYETNFRASTDTETLLKKYLEQSTPINMDDEIENAFGYWLTKELVSAYRSDLRADECEKFWEKHRTYGKSVQYIQSLLKRRGWSRHTKAGTVYQMSTSWTPNINDLGGTELNI